MASRSKLKFCDGERVLCYEPDPTKAKVLYDSKVLDVVMRKDSRGKKTFEYLIHFQGWNSSWDRYVEEEFVLKDIPENRQLQRDLAEQSQLQLGAYLYRRERKKHNRKIDYHNNALMSEDGSSGSPAQTIEETEESASTLSSSETESALEDEIVPIQLTDYLKRILEYDYNLINNCNKLMKLPAELHVVAILESYWKYYCTNLLSGITEKTNRRLNRTVLKIKPEDLQRNLNICKEMLDGLRIYFDFTLSDLLLYNREKGQVNVSYAKSVTLRLSTNEGESVKNSSGGMSYNRLSNNLSPFGYQSNTYIAHRTRRSLKANQLAKVVDTNGGLKEESMAMPTTQTKETLSNSTSDKALAGMEKMLLWQLLPGYVYNQQPLPPSLVYGATHLLRLFVKLPEILTASGLQENKLKVLQEHLEQLLNYLSEHKEWYGDQFYMEQKL